MIREGAALRADSIAYLTGAAPGCQRPASISHKFDSDGAVLPFPGNTFICHIPAESDAHHALIEASQTLQAGPQADAFTFLPPASFHMTVFEGITDARRDHTDWPDGIAPDATVQDVTRHFAEHARRLSLPPRQMIRPTGIFGGFSVAVSGATPEDEQSLRHSRALLHEATAIRRPDFASYDFHITLAYLLRWLTLAEAEAVMDVSDVVFRRLRDRCPHIELGAVEFCSFDDMHAFRPVVVI